MKKTLSRISLLLFLGLAITVPSNAQVDVRTITVNVDLRDVTGTSPTDPTGPATVDFTYATAADYNNDKTTTVNDQIRVTSTRAYNLNVRGSGDFTGTTSSANTLPLNILRASAKSSTGTGGFGTEVTPTTSSTVLLANQPAAQDQGYDFQYRIPQNSVLLSAAKDIYTTNLIYSITAL